MRHLEVEGSATCGDELCSLAAMQPELDPILSTNGLQDASHRDSEESIIGDAEVAE